MAQETIMKGDGRSVQMPSVGSCHCLPPAAASHRLPPWPAATGYVACTNFPALICRLPTPIQAEAVPLILGGGDVMAAAETGSGKTGAFALPVLQIGEHCRNGMS